MTAIAELFERQTVAGFDWRPRVDGVSSDRVVGEVLRHERWLEVDWVWTDGENLKSRHSREYDLVRRNVAPVFSRPTRGFDTDFVVSPTRNAFVYYTCWFTVAASGMGGTDFGTVNMLLDGVSSGATVSRLLDVHLLDVLVLILGLNMTQSDAKEIFGFVPAGSTVRLQKVGAGDCQLVASAEILL